MAKKAKRPARRAVSRKKDGGSTGRASGAALSFNHAMLYSTDVARSVKFYADGLGFRTVEEFVHEGRPVYARLRAPGGDGTIALHLLEPGQTMPEGEGVRLYFEVKDLEKFCEQIEAEGIPLDEQPKPQRWGWTHAYLRDPDGHNLSLYWAGAKRFQKSKM
jgi:catechol 2,3-dioxygenase-like lactoylglutathione lyase family enzyme